MSKQTLTIPEIKESTDFLRDINPLIMQRQQAYPLATKISALPIPSKLSESIALRLLGQGKILPELQGYLFERTHKHDIMAYSQDRTSTLAIEVKANGIQGFQRLSTGDLTADYLIWIAFREYFTLNDQSSFTIYTLSKPDRFFHEKGHMSLQDFLKIAGKELIATDIQEEDLHTLHT